MIDFLNLQKVNERYYDELSDAVSRVARSGRYLYGPETESFEKEYADYIGSGQCVCCGSGLDALWLIFRAYIETGRLRAGDEVIIPANTFIASVLSVTENGLTPVLAEPRYNTLELDADDLERCISERTRALLLVHLYGRNACTDRILELCGKYGLLLIEDNAQAHGCMWNGRHTGSIGDAAGHSFYPGKNMGTFGNAGAVTTDDAALADVVRSLANYGSKSKYVFGYCGRNSRVSEIDAAVLRVRLRHLDSDNDARRRIAGMYYGNVRNGLITLPDRLPDSENVYHIFPVLCSRRDDLQRYLSDNGVGTLVHYPVPPHKQECYRELRGLELPVTERIHSEELSVPISPALTVGEAGTVISLLNAFR